MYYITFRSLTRAQVAQAVLGQYHISNRLVRAPRALAERGCAYSLTVDGDALSRTLSALRQGGAGWERVFLCRADGLFEELRT